MVCLCVKLLILAQATALDSAWWRKKPASTSGFGRFDLSREGFRQAKERWLESHMFQWHNAYKELLKEVEELQEELIIGEERTM